MDRTIAATIVIDLTASLSWISLRWLRTAAIGAPALSALIAFALISGGTAMSGIRSWCAELILALDMPSVFLEVIVPLLLFTFSMCCDVSLRGKTQIASSGVAIFRWLLVTFLVAGVFNYISQGAAAWLECVQFGSLISIMVPIDQVRVSARGSAPEIGRSGLITESLIKYTLAVSLCMAVLILRESGLPEMPKIAFLAIVQTGCGFLLGIVAGWTGARATDDLEDRRAPFLVVGVLLCMAFLTSRYFGLVGYIEALASGFAFRLSAYDRQNREIQKTLADFWNAIADIENSVLFVLLSLWVAANGINATTIAVGAAAVLVILVVRFASTRDVLLCLVKKTTWNRPRAPFDVLGSYNGVPVALAFAIPYPDTRSRVLGAMFVVSLFSTVVQGGMSGWISHFGLPNADQPHLAQN